MKNTIKITATLMLAFSLIACGGGNVKQAEYSYLGLGDVRVNPDQVPLVSAVSVNHYSVSVILYAGSTPQSYFSFTLGRENVKAGYSADNFYGSNKKLMANANWNGRYYFDSHRFPTYAHFEFKSLTEQEAIIEVSARLVDTASGDYIDLPRIELKVQGADLEVLTERTT